MSGNHETIIPVGNPVKKFPSGLQEFLKTASEGGQETDRRLYRIIMYDLQCHKGRSALRDYEYVKRRIE